MRTDSALRLRLLVVIPAFNEMATIATVVADVRSALPCADLLVIDDGSSDGTARAACEAGAAVARLPFNLGVGGAMRTGYRHAVRGGYDAVVQVDGDGQHDPRYISSLVSQLATHDLVIGARFAGAGHYPARGPRRWAMRVLATLMSQLVHTPLDDATSGFRAAGPRAIRIFAEHYPAEYLGDTLETLVIARKSALSVVQVPVAMHPRAGGRPSHSPLASTVELARAAVVVGLGLVRDWPMPVESTS